MSTTFHSRVTADVKIDNSVDGGSYDHGSQTWVHESSDTYAGFHSRKSTTSWYATGANGGDCSPIYTDDTKTVFWD